ncbi:MAG TPA: prolipoprotein diacylglyceryl transferase [Allosphingosinicella sp.]
MIAADVSEAIHYNDLGIGPVIFQVGGFALRWYSIAYLAGILIGWWYLLKLIERPGAPMARRHADDMVFYATLGIILGGRLGYVLFYKPAYYFSEPLQILRLWDGGMSFHGGVIGTSLGIFYLARKNGLNWLRIHDYVACAVPFGLFFGRLANFVNAELWGRQTDVPWGVVFPDGGPLPRHPSQLYEAGLEGIVLFLILWFLFWRTDARYYPGRLVGWFLLGYGVSRFIVEFWREPDQHLVGFAQSTGLHMGQWLSVPMILAGAWFIATSGKRRQRVEPIAGGESVA